MSYMDFPRVHFGGTFEAGPSTINNVPDNYKPGQTSSNPVWNPFGNAYIQLVDCKVTGALAEMGGKQDATLKGHPVTSTDNWGDSGVPAKIVDLDPEQQMVSMFYGLQFKIGDGSNYVIAERTRNGRATATIKGGDPDGYRQYIDGQVYALGFSPDPPSPDHDPNAFLSLLVHDRFDKAPTWDNIQPIMQQYAVLYPVMKVMGIDLADPKSLQANKSALLRVFGLPIENPAYMPVVRDLSEAKRDAIVAWLNGLPDA